MRATASATLSFGLVAVPVKLYTATESKERIAFNMLHATCGSRLKQQYVCPRDGEIVERAGMVKGYEFAKDRYVTFTPEEIKSLEEAATQVIEIAEFVPESTVDPLYFEKPYFLGPDKGGGKAYSLLAEAMRRTKRVAIARYAARGKSYVVLVRALSEGMALHQLYYSDEVRSVADVPLDVHAPAEKDLKLAEKLIGKLSSDRFVPEQYTDNSKARMLAAIQQKVDGGEMSVSVEAPPKPTDNLLAALEASLQ